MSAPERTKISDSQDSDWWRGAVIYQIYPRSFQDSNGDGVGDLGGIAKRLTYISSLGVDAIWISPFFTSPMKDFGYDVSNYRDVDPMFGSLDDFDILLGEAHRLGLKVMIDLVLSHTSEEHPWFIASKKNSFGEKANWYVWANPKPDGTPPNNWLSIFGGSAWTWNAKREQYYLHNFLSSQPDLNFHEPDVQQALLDIARFWLERGVDGFRLDTINFYFADKDLRDNPALPRERRNATIAPSVNPYNHQEHIYSKNQPENVVFLSKFRSLLNEYYARVAIGEVGDAQRGLEILGEYTSGPNGVHMCYAFEFLSPEPLTATLILQTMTQLQTVAQDGWACWAYSNHDVQRHASRWNLTGEAQRCYTSLLLCLRGSVCLYQGEELGLIEADLEFSDLRDPYGIEFWPEFKGRDGCRTPMVWDADLKGGGFSKAKPWLPISSAHLPNAVSEQEKSPDASLQHYRHAINFRRHYPVLAKGNQYGMHVDGDILSFMRSDENEQIFCVFNLSDISVKKKIPAGNWQPIGHELGGVPPDADGVVRLAPWQASFMLRQI